MGIEDGAAKPPFMVSNRGVALALALDGLAVVVLFASAPGLDLAAAAAFYAGGGRFVGATPLGSAAAPELFSVIPFLLLGGAAALYGLRRLGRPHSGAHRSRRSPCWH